MKLIAPILLVCFTASGQVGPSSNSTQPLQIVISPSVLQVKVGLPARVVVRISNTSNYVINLGAEHFVHGGIDARFQYYCSDETQRSVKRSYPIMGSLGDRTMIVLKPGEAHTEKIDVSSACDLATPGTYEVQLSRDLTNLQSNPIVSNKVTVSLTP